MFVCVCVFLSSHATARPCLRPASAFSKPSDVPAKFLTVSRTSLFAYCASSGSDFLATSVCGYKPPDSRRANTFNGFRVGTTTPGFLQEQEEQEDETLGNAGSPNSLFFQQLKGKQWLLMDVRGSLGRLFYFFPCFYLFSAGFRATQNNRQTTVDSYLTRKPV